VSRYSKGVLLTLFVVLVLLFVEPRIGLPALIVVIAALMVTPAVPHLAYWNWAIVERLFPHSAGFWLSGRGNYLEVTARTRRCWSVDRPCEGARCNAWRWNRNIFSWRGMFTRRRGRCDTSAYRDIKR
jgi:hypothetical protein